MHFPFRVWKSVKKIQGRLIRELEKKFSKRRALSHSQPDIPAQDLLFCVFNAKTTKTA